MYDPDCSDSYCEYIEVYNNETSSVNMTGWKIRDNSGEDTLDDLILPGKSYGLIVDSDTRVYSNFDVGEMVWIYVDDNAIGNGLGNSENLTLKDDSNNTIDLLSYSGGTSGQSFSYINGNWTLTEASPGKDNVENTNQVNDYSVISISEFLPDPEGEDSTNMPKGEWVELYNNGNEDLDLLGFELYDNYGSEADIVITETTTLDGTLIRSKNYLVVYMNGVNGFLTNKGFEKINLYDLEGNLIDDVSYDGSDEGVSWSFIEEKWQKSEPTLGYRNLDNSSSIKSEIRIEEIYDLGDGKAEWGDIIRAKLFVKKGNTNKNVVWIWIEDSEGNRVTKKSKFNVYDKFLNYTFTYPIGIPDNCNDEFFNGKGKIKISGLDAEAEENLEIREKPNCKDGTKKARIKSFEYELLEFSEEIKDDSNFETKVRLKNNQKEDLKVDIWSYIYSGKTHYVEDNDKENMHTLTLKASEEKIVELKNEVVGVSKAKSPRFKVNILKEDRKTPLSLIEEIKVSKNENVKKGLDSITGEVIYESKGVKAQRSAVFFFSGLMMTLGIYSFVRKWN
jgi:uncharacterized protein YcfL